MNEEILTMEEVAQYLKISERAVYDWVQKKKIPAGKIGTSWRFKKSEILRWVDEQFDKLKQELPVSISDILTPENILLSDFRSKTAVLNSLISVLSETHSIENPEIFSMRILEREQMLSTAIGLGIAVPHVHLSCVNNIVMACAVNRFPIPDYNCIDGEPVRIVLMIASGFNQQRRYLSLLSSCIGMLKERNFQDLLFNASSREQVWSLLAGTSSDSGDIK
ncbi:MAG: hypothetical protein A2096_16875 [Spirochaetes bacterium GWF1_41_5]|nr:MAG: hypothetical protein A2096_16875 [Spirochaetes bacterium GWF1_41_5]HBE03469.1 PTS fructose transporter subunit IIA [Spirochaetia bacterium]